MTDAVPRPLESLGRKALHSESQSTSPAMSLSRNNMANKFERHRQVWTPAEISKLRIMAGKGWSRKTIATALTRSEESVKKQAKLEKLKISKAR